MKIQCLIERKGGTTVTFDASARWPAGEYHFLPDPSEPRTPHLAEVTEELHIHRFLGMPDTYRAYIAGQTKPAAPAQPAQPGATGGVALPPKQPDPAATTTPAVDPAKVTELRELTIKDLKANINTYSTEQLAAALAAEKADDPRKGWVEVVEAHLGEGGAG